ncbi:MAG: DUF1743 domain-containing protein [Nitrososphaerota archaeon]|nr:DUF1743 domain-containing protein [Nitrososphaerota archaeon]
MPTALSTFHIGIDDTDSSDGMCTTFLCYNLVKEFSRLNVKLLDYPNLIRLNPNIPWKTRGNAALVLRVQTDLSKERLFKICESYVRRFATSPRANSGLVILEGESIPEEIQGFSKRALYSVLGLNEARALMTKYGLHFLGLRSQQGLVGALAGVGNTLSGDYTYELIAYRDSVRLPRKIDRSKIVAMSLATYPKTFSNLDREYGRIMIAPHGPDPVLCGIRGEKAEYVLDAFKRLLPVENLSGWMIVRSNQGTAEHLNEVIELSEPKAYVSGKVRGVVSSVPRVEMGGHVFFGVQNEGGNIECACYEPTADFRKYAMRLIPGDAIEVGGGVRKSTSKHSKVLNLEYFEVLKLATKSRLVNPKCSACGATMKSEGSGQGFACQRCGLRDRIATKSEIKMKRDLEKKMYLPPVKAHRHLTKPLQRYGVGRKSVPVKLLADWIR